MDDIERLLSEAEGENKNREVAKHAVVGSLEEFREHFWPIYESYGFTFAEGYRAFQVDVPMTWGNDDDDEADSWKHTKS